MTTAFFDNYNPSFCDECGCLLPTPGETETVVCPRCKFSRSAADFENIETVAVSREFAFQAPKFDTQVDAKVEVLGAKAMEACPKCGKREMTFTTAQLRSADEGQTIFYTCQACSHKYNLNS